MGDFRSKQAAEKERRTVFDRLAEKRFLGRIHLAKYLHGKQRQQCKHRTLSNYCISITFFLQFAVLLGSTKLEQLTFDDLEAFIETVTRESGRIPRMAAFGSRSSRWAIKEILP